MLLEGKRIVQFREVIFAQSLNSHHMKKYIFGIGVIAILFITYFIIDSVLFDGIRPKAINENGIQANYFVKDIKTPQTSILLIGGGSWGDYWGQEFAKQGFVGVSLPYIGREGLPKLPEAIKLEYFEEVIAWLRQQPEVDPEKIIVMGASRNAELALVLAFIYPDLISGVIAYAPSSVSWSNTVLPYNSDEIKPSWTYKGADIPYVPMDKIVGNSSTKIETLDYWKSGLAKEAADLATIKVEQINGPILLLSGKDDKVWPSANMADQLAQRVKENNFQHAFYNIQYENAGHLISSNPEVLSTIRLGTINIGGKDYEFEYGGTNEGDQAARKNAKVKVLDFIEKM